MAKEYFYITLQAFKLENKYMVQYRNGEPVDEVEALDDVLSDWGQEGFRLRKAVKSDDGSLLLIMEAVGDDD